ncbi:hypothetical protein EDC01DRAFT_304769 [Geopyxis carbonaria]|nr:hypothetical protein EDC01DRAFT_304769 [Geopyxis carbonaria]
MEPQSNNPFRQSMLPPTAEEPSSPSSLTPASNHLYTFNNTSAATTVAAETRPSHDSCGGDLANAKTVTGSINSLEMQPLPPKAKEGDVVITIHDSTSQTSVPVGDALPYTKSPRASMACGGDRRSMRASMQVDQCTMWPARRQNEKANMAKKRRWMWIKIAIALIIIIGAVALGLGITKAVTDAKKN